MTATRLPRRRGVTLTECMVALFVMALGFLALLTLFPLGAMQVSQALKDDRCAQTASQAQAYMQTTWRTQVVEFPAYQPNESFVWAMDDPNLVSKFGPITAPPGGPLPVNLSGLYVNTYLSPSYVLPTGNTVPAAVGDGLPVDPNADLVNDLYPSPGVSQPGAPVVYVAPPGPRPVGTTSVPPPSYPVLVDPIGTVIRAGNLEANWLGRSSISTYSPLLLPRRTLSAFGTSVRGQANPLNGTTGPYQAFALTDDLSYSMNGSAGVLDTDTSLGGSTRQGVLARQGRYTWAAIVQRPRNDVMTTANLTIMVFDGRILTSAANEEVVVSPPTPADTTLPNANFVTVGSRSIDVIVPARGADQSVLVRKGGWIMDGTIGKVFLKATPATPIANQVEGIDYLFVRSANFYRIAGVTEIGATTVSGVPSIGYTLDLETPIKPLWNGSTVLSDTGASINYSAQLYFFGGLAEVFEKPFLKPDTITQP